MWDAPRGEAAARFGGVRKMGTRACPALMEPGLMSSVPVPASHTPAQLAANAQGRAAAVAVREHRANVAAMTHSRAGMCMANGWDVSIETIDGDFELDAPLLRRLFDPEATSGPSLRAAPPMAGGLSTPAGPSALEPYLFPPLATAALGSSARYAEEVPGAVYGPGNLLSNVGSATAGALQGMGERAGARTLQQGVQAIMSRAAQRVVVAPGMALYNAAQPHQTPRVRLRVRGLPIAQVRAMVPGLGGPVTQWRVNGPGTGASLRVRGMTAQQLRQTAILAGQERLPAGVRWASGRVGGGILTFGPTAALDFYSAIETDLQTGSRSFNVQAFAVAEARNQSGNAVGFGAGMLVTGVAVVVGGAATAASAPVVLLALGVGLIAQVVWNAAGGADWAEGTARSALH